MAKIGGLIGTAVGAAVAIKIADNLLRPRYTYRKKRKKIK